MNTSHATVLAIGVLSLVPPSLAQESSGISHGGRKESANGAFATDRQITLHIHAVLVSDDDGGRAVDVTPRQFAEWVTFANRVYAKAGIRFEFDPSVDVSDVKSTRLNNVMGTEDADWIDARREGNALAADLSRKGKLVVICRHGPGISPNGKGFSWWDYNFVVMPGHSANTHCGGPNTSALAHEIGHFLGLPHTFGGAPFTSRKEAEEFFEHHDRDAGAFDGDGISDTPPHPSIRDMECKGFPKEVRLHEVRFDLPRRNVMSYFQERDSLTPDQGERVRWVARKRLDGGMAMPTNADASSGGGELIEIDTLPVVRTSGPNGVRQVMDGFGMGAWNNGYQAFFGEDKPCSIIFSLNVPQTGLYRVTLFATQAPDYGVIQTTINRQDVGKPFDGYSPIVIPSGPIDLGEVEFKKLDVELEFRALRKNVKSTRHLMGLDCIRLTPVH